MVAVNVRLLVFGLKVPARAVSVLPELGKVGEFCDVIGVSTRGLGDISVGEAERKTEGGVEAFLGNALAIALPKFVVLVLVVFEVLGSFVLTGANCGSVAFVALADSLRCMGEADSSIERTIWRCASGIFGVWSPTEEVGTGVTLVD